MEYIDTVDISKMDFDRINQLYDIDFDDESEEMQELIDKLDARKNTIPYTFMWNFEDGTSISMDVYATDLSIYSIWSRSTETRKELLCFDFKLDEEIVFTDIGDDKNTYICRFNIGE